jgi:hypothetical protein
MAEETQHAKMMRHFTKGIAHLAAHHESTRELMKTAVEHDGLTALPEQEEPES